MKKIWPFAGVLVCIAALSFILFNTQEHTKTSLKCKAFSRATVDIENGALVFSVVENLQLYNNKDGMIQYEGYVKSPKENTYLERTVYLSEGVKVDKETYNFKINKIVPSPLDTTPDEIFNQMWLEITSDNQSVTLSFKKIKDNMYLVNGPYSPQFTCVGY